MSRLRAFILIFLFLVLTGFGLSRITLNVDVLALLPQDLPEVQGVQHFYRHFSRPDELIITLEGEGVDSAAASLAEELEKHADLVESVVWNFSPESNPDAAAELLAYIWLYAQPEQVENLMKRLAPESLEADLDQLVEDLAVGLMSEDLYLRTYDPLGLIAALPGGLETPGLNPSRADRSFAAEDQAFRAIYVKVPGGRPMNYQQASLWLEKIERVVDQWNLDRGGSEQDEGKPAGRAGPLQISYTGEPAFVAEIGSAMEQDMSRSVTSTILLICLFFWILHRRLLPLLWLVAMLTVTFGLTLAIGSILISELSIMSVGFAAILVGLTIDYGVILYKEARLTPGDPSALKRLVGPSIRWAAATTASVFFALQLSSFPGIAQLGLLVAIGVLVGSVVMLIFYAPVAARTATGLDLPDDPSRPGLNDGPDKISNRLSVIRVLSIMVPLACVIVFVSVGFPGFEQNFKPLQLRDSGAMEAMEKMGDRLGRRSKGTQSVVVAVDSMTALPKKLEVAQNSLQSLQDNEVISSFTLPLVLIPNSDHIQRNRQSLRSLAGEKKRLAASVEKAGFNEEAMQLADRVFASWDAWLHRGGGEQEIVFPQNKGSRWFLDRLLSIDREGNCAVLGRVVLEKELESITETTNDLAAEGIYITGWNTLDPTVNRLIHRDMTHVLLPVSLALVAMLSLIFRDWRDITLSLATMIFSFLALLALLSLLGVEWNAFSLSSIPILFGVGLDYSIHMVFALRRNEGDLQAIRRGIYRAILFCGLSTAVGFGSLSLASNLGLASIGRICGLGVLIIMGTTLGLLPHWWRFLRLKERQGASSSGIPPGVGEEEDSAITQ